MNIIFFGTSEFGEIILEKLINKGFKPSFVVTMPDKPVGRKKEITPPPVKITAQKYNIPVLQPEKLLYSKFPAMRDPARGGGYILNSKPDIIIVAAYGQIIPKNILDIPKYGFLNVHPSLLPKYRGPSPVQAAILNGDTKTGVTIMLMDEKMDHGKILSTIKYKPSAKETYVELHNKLADLGSNLLLETIPKWINGEIKAREQDHSKATFTKIIKKEDGLINWQKTAIEIERQMRAFEKWPSAYFKLKTENEKGKTTTKNLKLLKVNLLKLERENEIEPGTFFLTEDKKLAIKCRENALLVEELQIEGKKPMTGKEFINGYFKK